MEAVVLHMICSITAMFDFAESAPQSTQIRWHGLARLAMCTQMHIGSRNGAKDVHYRLHGSPSPDRSSAAAGRK
jgi:hypothetical protein